MLALIQDPVFVVDRDKKVIYANDAAADLVGKKREQVMGVPGNSLITVEESGADNTLATGRKAKVESWVTIKDKRYFLEFKPTPLMDDKGNIIGVLETMKDITGHRVTHEQPEDGKLLSVLGK
jgi:PAS domain S-box-containing protein